MIIRYFADTTGSLLVLSSDRKWVLGVLRGKDSWMWSPVIKKGLITEAREGYGTIQRLKLA